MQSITATMILTLGFAAANPLVSDVLPDLPGIDERITFANEYNISEIVPFNDEVLTLSGATLRKGGDDDDDDGTPLIAQRFNTDSKCTYSYAKALKFQCFPNINGCYPKDQWGWANLITRYNEKMVFFHKNKGCDTRGADVIGYADVSVVNNNIEVDVKSKDGWEIRGWRSFVGQTRLPIRQRKYRSSPFSTDFKQFKHYSKFWRCPRPAVHTWIVIYAEFCPVCYDEDRSPVVKVINTGDDWNTRTRLPSNDIIEGMLGWSLDGENAYLHHFPAVYSLPNMKVYFPPQDLGVAAGSRFKFYCPKNCDKKPCEVIIVHYHCPPCSGDTNGDLPHILPKAGWAPGHCGPKFRFLADKYDTTAFRSLVPAGETLKTPPLGRILTNTAIFVRTGATECEKLDKFSCIAKNECRYDFDDEECYSNWCPPAPRGPGRVCEPCAETLPGTI